MVDNIKQTFLKNIENLRWMDEETKVTSIKKIKTMKQYIGFPTWLKNKQELEQYYDNVGLIFQSIYYRIYIFMILIFN